MAARLRIRDGGATLRTITRVRMRDESGTLRLIQRIRMRDEAGTLRTVFQYLSVTLSTYDVFEMDAAPVTSFDVYGAVTGGVGPFTYSWERISGVISILADTPTTLDTFFKKATGAPGTMYEATFHLKVTDANGAIAYSPPVLVQLEFI